MFNINRFINDSSFELHLFNNRIDCINYYKVYSINDDLVSINISDNKFLYIKGSKLKVTKLIDREIVINGIITNIEFV